MNSQNERWVMRLKAIEAEYYSIDNLKNWSKYFVFAPLQFSRQEWSVAPSVFNIKVQGLAHCLH